MKKCLRYGAFLCLLAVTALLWSGCQKTENAVDNALNISVNMGTSDADSLALVNEAFDSYVYEKLGFHARLLSTPGPLQERTDEADDGPQADISSVPLFQMQQMARSNELHPLDSLLETCGQELLAVLDEDSYSFISRDGPLYGLPTNGEHCQIQGFEYNQEIADRYGLDLSGVQSPEDLTPVFAALKEKAPEITPVLIRPRTFSYNQVDYLDDGFGVLTRDSGTTVVDLYQTEQFAALMRLFYDWQQAGYVCDYLQDEMADAFYLSSGQVFGTLTTGKVGFAAQETKNIGYQMGFIPLSDPYSTTLNQSTFWYVIPASCKEPEKAMRLLNLMYTDPTVANLVMYGIEGVHYQRLSADSNIISPLSSGYAGPSGWAYCNQYIAYLWEGYDPDIWEQTEAINQIADRSPALGFRFDSVPVSDQLYRCNKVSEQYLTLLGQGLADPNELLPVLQKELKDAGIDEIIAEKQRQLDRFLRDNP